LLAQEIGKLPEIQDGISDSEAIALEKLCDLYMKNPENFNKTFEKMYQVGKPEVRRYCSPLQAVYWLIMDGKTDAINIHNYDLTNPTTILMNNII
jgi:hypothetical protein